MTKPIKPDDYDKNIALVLQGGGALGSYQCGAYEALSEANYLPDWVAGISIGAINAALIAGNSPDQRVEKLREFWNSITTPPTPWEEVSALFGASTTSTSVNKQVSALHALMVGQANFFTLRSPVDWISGSSPTSFYDTKALKLTLERLVDFDRINAKDIRFSVGAVNVCTGNFAYFDNMDTVIRAEHVMASGALPPGFPAVEIDGEQYWDGGLVSNTPLQHIIDYRPRRSHLIFQVDVFPTRGPVPENMDQVGERDKDIRYSSRTRTASATLAHLHDLRHNINQIWDTLPEDWRNGPGGAILDEFRCVTTMDIVQLIYRPDTPQGQAKDFEFDRPTMENRWASGYADAAGNLQASPWLAPMPPQLGARTFDVMRGKINKTAPSAVDAVGEAAH